MGNHMSVMGVYGSGYLTYDAGVDKLTVGTWRRILVSGTFYCELSVDTYRYRELERFGFDPDADDNIPDTFLTEPLIYFEPYPEFIWKRVFDPRRPDRPWEKPPYNYLKYAGKEYDPFDFMLYVEGRNTTDNWCVLQKPANTLNLPEPKYK
ncbi:MAG: hypothetical protein NC548_10885 [Lachnospiraceae bacterium]|nr:hypothetical protein [Lachnospiraceae bacterium]